MTRSFAGDTTPAHVPMRRFAGIHSRALREHQWRLRKAYHEAGHAVVGLLDGWPTRYLTMRPRSNPGGAMVVDRWTKTVRTAWRTPWWETDLAVTAGGMAASAARHVLFYGRDDAILWHPRVVDEGGGGSGPEGGDMPYLRYAARRIWCWATFPPKLDKPVDHGPAFNPAWAGDPAGVEAIARHGWNRAVDLVCANWGAVAAVARAAMVTRRALTGAEMAAIIAGAPAERIRRRDVTLEGGRVDWWPGTYSPLQFRPSADDLRKLAAARVDALAVAA